MRRQCYEKEKLQNYALATGASGAYWQMNALDAAISQRWSSKQTRQADNKSAYCVAASRVRTLLIRIWRVNRRPYKLINIYQCVVGAVCMSLLANGCECHCTHQVCVCARSPLECADFSFCAFALLFSFVFVAVVSAIWLVIAALHV